MIALAIGLAGCVPVPSPAPVLDQRWMIGIEHMRGDAMLLQPFTNRLLAALAAMPKVQVVHLGATGNEPLFTAYTGDKLRVMPWLHAEGSCMEITTTIIRGGRQGHAEALVVPPLPAGPEPDTACIDRAATLLYQSWAREGL